MIGRRRLIAVVGALVLLAGGWFKLPAPRTPQPSRAPKAWPAQSFQRLEGCRYKAQEWNDGDSFHVTLADGTEQIFRLYFVDAPEAGEQYVERTAEQAAYFGISPSETVAVGQEADEFTKRALAKPFTVVTRWHTALGRSKLPRYYAMITTADGKDLGEILVSNGLVRIYGARTPLPDGRDSRAYLDQLKALEVKAQANRRGGWRRIGQSAAH